MKDELRGIVQKYKGNGRQLGYPTANIDSATHLADGVYFGYADLQAYKNHPALIFIGTPVTMGDTIRRVEAHLLDIPDIDYYGSELLLTVEHFHRSNQHFASVADLVEAMKDDALAARRFFGEK